MSRFEDLVYVSRSGLRAGVGHATDDPYSGKPKSDLGLRVVQEGPEGVSWTHDGQAVDKNFKKRIQAAFDATNDLLVVIVLGGSSIGDFDLPNNGVVFNPDGSVHRRIMVPPRITRTDVYTVLAPGSKRILVPEGLTLVRRAKQGIEIFLSYLDGDWNEMRLYNPKTGEWGETTGQYRLV